MIIENAEGQSQQVLGKFKPRADQSKYRSTFAVVEGRHTSGWPTLRDITTHGVPIHDGSLGYLRHTEFRDENNNTNDVVLQNGTVVRECVTELKYAEVSKNREANVSNERLNDFLTNNKLKRNEHGGQLRMDATVETTEQEREFQDVTNPSAAPKPRGRPPKTNT